MSMQSYIAIRSYNYLKKPPCQCRAVYHLEGDHFHITTQSGESVIPLILHQTQR